MEHSSKTKARTTHLLVECPHCKQPGFIESSPRIVSSRDEHATEQLLKGKLFKYTCPMCHKTTSMIYDCLYHDTKHRAFMMFSTSKNPEKNVPALEELRRRMEESLVLSGETEGETPVAGTPSFKFEHYQVRLVTQSFQFFEKARIWNDGYDDRVIELMKVAIKRGMLKEGIIGENDTMIYERTLENGGISFVVVGEIPGDSVGVPQGYDYCKTFLEEGEMQGALADEYTFDHAWATRYLP